jgi:hypothetical protein
MTRKDIDQQEVEFKYNNFVCKQNKNIERLYNDFYQPFQGIFLERRKHMINYNDMSSDISSNNNNQETKSQLDLIKHEDVHNIDKHIGYCNLKIHGDHTKINLIDVMICGMSIERIYPKDMGEICEIELFKMIVPALSVFNNICLYINHSTDVTIEYDVFEIQNPIKEKEIRECCIVQNQYTGKEIIYHLNSNILNNGKQYAKIKLNFSHPVTKIRVLTNNKISNVRLNFDIALDFKKISNTEYEYNFEDCCFTNTKFLNFSKILNPILSFEIYEETEICVFAKSLNILAFNTIQCGLRYSN